MGGGGASGDLVLAELPAICVCQAELVRPEKRRSCYFI